ncbi:hypothetical protein TMatcc_005801 [Talaromyces marneffei ATCC 18224]
MTHSMQNTNGALNVLPVEIHLIIIDYLGYTARIALAYTNHYFNEIVVRQPPATREGKLEFVCDAETWPIYTNINYLACNQCLKLRPIHAFADKQLRGKRSRGYSDNNRRFCIRCGIQKHIYLPGHLIPIDKPNAANTHGFGFSICWCCKFHGRGSYCLVFGSCEDCEQVPPTLHYIWSPTRQPCMQHFNCLCCGREGSLEQDEQPLRGQIDDIIRQYRVRAT